MAERTQDPLPRACRLLRENADALPADQRRGLARAIAEAMTRGEAGDAAAAAEVLDLLVRDPDWTVRLAVARMVHLLDDDACSRCVAVLRADCNSYVRGHAERGLARQRKARRTSTRKRGERRSYCEQLDELARRYGKQLAAKVQELADRRYADLSSAVVHDVRSILTTLLPNAAALVRESADGSRAASVLEDIQSLQRIIEAMEQFSKPLPAERHPEDLRELLNLAVERARAGVAAQGHDGSPVEVALGDVPSIRLRVARPLLVLALTNVIQNALESFAARETDVLRPGRIDLQVDVDGYETRIILRDNGPGLEPEVLREVAAFLPTGPNRSKRSSSGWGLPLAHKYVTAHGGTLTIDSEIGRGTTVVIALPMRNQSEADDE